MKTDLFALSQPIKASCNPINNGVVLTLSTPEDGNEIAVFLPDHMKACVAMIVEAFNAHAAGAVPETGEPTDYYVGPDDGMLRLGWDRVSKYGADQDGRGGLNPGWGDVPFPTGSAIRTADAINLAQGWAALTDDDAMQAVERRDLP